MWEDNLRALNSFTKYPSIPTYHCMMNKGRLKEEITEGLQFTGDVRIHEKIDGENLRVIVLTDGEDVDYFIGSREDIKYARGDRLIPPHAAFARPTAEKIVTYLKETLLFSFNKSIQCFYFEIYGGKLPAARMYTNNKSIGLRLFDHMYVDHNAMVRLMNGPLDKISSWREHGGQAYANSGVLKSLADSYSLSLVPYVGNVDASNLPVTIEETYEFLKKFYKSQACIDTGLGDSEGIVIRTHDRSAIAKIRFEDYEKALNIRR